MPQLAVGESWIQAFVDRDTLMHLWTTTHTCICGPRHIRAFVDRYTYVHLWTATHTCICGPRHKRAFMDRDTYVHLWTATHTCICGPWHKRAFVDRDTYVQGLIIIQFLLPENFNPTKKLFCISDIIPVFWFEFWKSVKLASKSGFNLMPWPFLDFYINFDKKCQKLILNWN